MRVKEDVMGKYTRATITIIMVFVTRWGIWQTLYVPIRKKTLNGETIWVVDRKIKMRF